MFQLSYGDFADPLALPLNNHTEERLYQLICCGDDHDQSDAGRSVVARRIADLITTMLDGDLLPPSEKQLKYAIAIARELSLELPAEALQYRTAMSVFLATHAPQYRRRKGYERGCANAQG